MATSSTTTKKKATKAKAPTLRQRAIEIHQKVKGAADVGSPNGEAAISKIMARLKREDDFRAKNKGTAAKAPAKKSKAKTKAPAKKKTAKAPAKKAKAPAKKKATKAPAPKPLPKAASGITMYGHKLDFVVDGVLAHLKKAGRASRPAIATAVLTEAKNAPKWVHDLNSNERFRIVRKVLQHLEKAGKVTSRMGKSSRGNEAHMYKLAG